MILQQVHDHAVLEDHPMRFRRRKLDGLKGHRSWIAEHHVAGQHWESPKDQRHGQQARQETPSIDGEGKKLHAVHGATSTAATAAVLLSFPFLTRFPTVRLDLVK